MPSAGPFLACGLLAVLAACRDEPAAPPPALEPFLALHARGPDEVFEERARLAPTAGDPWGDLAWTGWSAVQDGAGEVHAWSDQMEAQLLLPALGPGERTLVLDAWTLPDEAGEPLGAEVRLNGVTLGPIELTPERAEHRIETPAAVWKRGRNELVIAVDALRTGADGRFASVALASVAYGVERRPLVAPPRLVLAADTSVRYGVRAPRGAVLRIAGAATGKGALAVSVSVVGGAAPPELQVFPAAGRLAAEIPLAAAVPGASAGELLWIELRWAGTVGTQAELEPALLAPAPTRRPSIVLVSIDTLSARHMSTYGYPRETTPNVDALAAESVRFERCSTNAPWTLPSYLSLMTGLYPFSSRMDLGGGKTSPYFHRLHSSRWTLAEDLRARGYRTAGFVDTLLLGERFGLAQGFETYDTTAAALPHEDPAGGIRHIVPRALEWIDAQPAGEPFFLFLHAYDVHGPYVPDPAYRGHFEGDALAEENRMVLAGAMTHTFGQVPKYIARGAVPAGELPERLPAAPIVAAYDEEILALDAALGELFESLRERGLYDDAILVFTADHGEATDEHDYFGHGLLYEEVVHVPLLVRLPGGVFRSVETPVQTVDLYPTLAELTGIPGPPGDGGPQHGRSLAPLLRGETLPEAPTFCEGGIMRMAAITHRGWKLIETEPALDALPSTMLSSPHVPRAWLRDKAGQVLERPLTVGLLEELALAHGPGFLEELSAVLPERVVELYYLPDDPRERNELSGERPDKVAELEALLAEAKAARTAARTATDEGRVALTPEDLAELEKLGYVDGN